VLWVRFGQGSTGFASLVCAELSAVFPVIQLVGEYFHCFDFSQTLEYDAKNFLKISLLFTHQTFFFVVHGSYQYNVLKSVNKYRHYWRFALDLAFFSNFVGTVLIRLLVIDFQPLRGKTVPWCTMANYTIYFKRPNITDGYVYFQKCFIQRRAVLFSGNVFSWSL